MNKEIFNLMIFGGRDFEDYSLLEKVVNYVLTKEGIRSENKFTRSVAVVSGKAKGADSVGEIYAHKYNCKILEYPARWNDLEVAICKVKYNQYGHAYNALAGFNRNQDMVNVCHLAIGFWDGKSHGTKDSIDRLTKAKKPHYVCRLDLGKLINYSDF